MMPNRIRSEIAVAMVGALLLASAVSAAAVFFFLPIPAPMDGRDSIAQLALLAQLFEASDSSERLALVHAAQMKFPDLAIASEPVHPERWIWSNRLAQSLRNQLSSDYKVYVVLPTGQRGDHLPSLAIQVPDGTTLVSPFPALPPVSAAGPLITVLVFLVCSIALLSLWAARALTAPLMRFADAAERFTGDRLEEPLSDTGPQEIRRVARALNEMRSRVRHLVEQRTLMLAAVSHDLRTPVTRLRLRAEEIEPAELRQKILRDLGTMQSVIQSALWFLRGDAYCAQRVRVDMSSLLQTVCDGFVDMGGAVSFTGPPHLTVQGDPEQLTRAITNLVDNGLKFGNSVVVRLKAASSGIVVEVEDNGPGILDAEKKLATEPFYRGDASRNLADLDSFGLGLSVARSITEGHGGKLSLLDAEPGGLLAKLTLPTGTTSGEDENI
jgi:signal transduction histidine kinase